jgi:hypothetical protein
MFEVVILFLGVTLGIIIGVASTMIYFNYLLRVVMSALHGRKIPDKVEAEGKVARCTAKIKRAVEIGKEQLELFGKMDGPNKSATHAKWKNELGARIRELEAEKIAIYREIVAEGFDPMITMIGVDGNPEQVKMSEVVKMHDRAPNTAPPPKPSPTLKMPEPTDAKVLKFTKKPTPKK